MIHKDFQKIPDCDATTTRLPVCYSLMLISVYVATRMMQYLLYHFITCNSAVNTMSNDSSDEDILLLYFHYKKYVCKYGGYTRARIKLESLVGVLVY